MGTTIELHQFTATHCKGSMAARVFRAAIGVSFEGSDNLAVCERIFKSGFRIIQRCGR